MFRVLIMQILTNLRDTAVDLLHQPDVMTLNYPQLMLTVYSISWEAVCVSV
jgi:hypothetical protein